MFNLFNFQIEQVNIEWVYVYRAHPEQEVPPQVPAVPLREDNQEHELSTHNAGLLEGAF